MRLEAAAAEADLPHKPGRIEQLVLLDLRLTKRAQYWRQLSLAPGGPLASPARPEW